jgi:hypothetical protein
MRGTSRSMAIAAAEGHGEQAAEQRPEQVRHARAGPPDAQGAAATLGRETRYGARQRGRADQAGARALDDPRDDQLAEGL